MADTDLVFSSAPGGSPADLVFGAEDTTAATDATVSGSVAIRKPVAAGLLGLVQAVDAAIVIRKPQAAAEVIYNTDTARPTVAQASSTWQAAVPSRRAAQPRWQASLPSPRPFAVRWQPAAPAAHRSRFSSTDALSAPAAVRVRAQQAQRAAVAVATGFEDAIHVRRHTASAFQQAEVTQVSQRGRYQDTLRDRRNRTAGLWQQASPQSRQQVELVQQGRPQFVQVTAVHQQGRRPPVGTWVPPGPEPATPCYTPSGALLFSDAWDGSPHLLFRCDGHDEPTPGGTVVVPVKRVYVVLNEVSLRRVDGNYQLPTFGMSMSLDCDSWTWTMDATLPLLARQWLQPASAGAPVELEALVNGVAHRFIMRKPSSTRQFGDEGLRIEADGLSTLLDAPFSPVQSFTGFGGLDASALLAAVLTDNGVGIGWDVDWQLDDWFIPAGRFTHQGTYISAVRAVVEAAGGYVQPTANTQVLRALPRYPTAPWDWTAVTPDFEIPAAVSTVESIDREVKADYNRVFVMGQRPGDPLGRVTRAGTGGDIEAPMVVDPLITRAAAARQRGIAVLGDTGTIDTVGLTLPVLSETGIIVPGKFVRYVDGSTSRIGLSRAVSVAVNAAADVFQTISLETHA